MSLNSIFALYVCVCVDNDFMGIPLCKIFLLKIKMKNDNVFFNIPEQKSNVKQGQKIFSEFFQVSQARERQSFEIE